MVINNKYIFDVLISTMPLNVLPFKLKGAPNEILEDASKLKYNKVSNVFWKTKPVKATWTYYPSPNTIFHRHIHIGNFFNPKENYTITESNESTRMMKWLSTEKKFDYLLEPLDYNISEHAYVVYDQNLMFNAVFNIKQYLETLGLHTLGRFTRMGILQYGHLYGRCFRSSK